MMRLLYLFIILILLSTLGTQAQTKLEKANKLYESHSYIKAIDLYQSVLQSEKSEEATIKLADSYRQINNTREAEKWYSKAVKMKSSKAIDKFYYAQILQTNGKCLEAKKWYAAYSKVDKSDKRPALLSGACDSLHLYQDDTARYKIKELKAINSKQSDFGGVIYQKGLMFTSAKTVEGKGKSKVSERDGNPYLNMYYSPNFRQSKFAVSYGLHDKLNTKYHDGPGCFNKDFTEIYFTRNSKGKGGVKRLKIYKAKIENENWKDIQALSFNSDNHSCGHPNLSPDGTTIFFTSEMKGGQGGTDIWMVTRKGDEWTSPKNLGPTINTKGNEMFPYLSDDKRFFFSSNGHPGIGGLDLYVAKADGENFTDVENLGIPINSTYDDFSLSIGRQPYIGYFSSNRPGGTGSDDLYEFQDQSQVQILKVNIEGQLVKKEKEKEVPVVGATVSILDEDDKEVAQQTTKNDGKFKFEVDTEKEYTLITQKDNFYTDRTPISTMGKGKPPAAIAKVKVETKEVVLNEENLIPNIYYDYNSSEFQPQALLELDKLVQKLKDNPNLIIQIGAHTDNRGNDEFNLKLSQKRAVAVMNYLIERGIPKSRLSSRGYGKTKPLFANATTEEEHAQNRRTEFTVLMIRQTLK
ncbi:MAG TPA: OmpA family protein [Cytophagaceae bacterium]